VCPAPTPKPKIRSPIYNAAKYSAAELLLEEDEIWEDCTVSLAAQLFLSDKSHIVSFPAPTSDNGYGFRSCWATALKQLGGIKFPCANEDPRRTRLPLSITPWADGHFLSEVAVTTMWRLFASSVSERQGGKSCVLLHNILYVISDRVHRNLPVIDGYYRAGDGHYVEFSEIPSLDLAGAIAGTAGLAIEQRTGTPRYICSKPGYEKAKMPFALALVALPKLHRVLFLEQFKWMGGIVGLLVVLLDDAWDHDDACECGDDGIPVKIKVEALRNWYDNGRHLALNPRPMEYLIYTSQLSTILESYFSTNMEMEVEIEDVVKLLENIEKEGSGWWSKASQSDLIERFYALYGFEGSRWLLLALVLTLGENLMNCATLPKEFDVLRRHRTCYLA